MTELVNVDLIHRAPKPPQKRKWLTYKTMTDAQRDHKTWPGAEAPTFKQIKEAYPLLSDVEASIHCADVAARFERLSRAVRVYLDTGSLKDALEEAQCGRDNFYEQLNRCLQPSKHHAGIVGWAGLIYLLRVRPTKGKFELWLEANPAWQKHVNALIAKGGGYKKINLKLPTVEHVVGAIRSSFSTSDPRTGRVAIQKGTYPNDGPHRSQFRRYVENYVTTHRETTGVWFGERAVMKQGLQTGELGFNFATEPLDVLGGDAHREDAIGIVILPGPAGPLPVPVKRMQIFVSCCQNSRVVAGYAVTIGAEIKAKHIDLAHKFASTPWKRKELTVPELEYEDGAGFPCGGVEGISEVRPALYRLDNGSQCWAARIREDVRSAHGCGVIWGGVGQWWQNCFIERLFATLEQYGFKRLPSTMGSGTQDPHRADDPALEACGKGIEWHELIQIIDVLLANYNATPHTDLGGLTPLQHLHHSLHGRRVRWLPRMSAPPTAHSHRLGTVKELRRIAGSRKDGVNAYVEIYEQRYTGKELFARYDLIGKDCIVHIPEDMRTAELYLATGEYIGTITVLDKGWNECAHSIEDRQIINSLIRQGKNIDRKDPVRSYAKFLADKVTGAVQPGGKPRVSKDASRLADLEMRTGATPLRAESQASAANEEDFDALRAAYGITLPDAWR